MSSTIAGSITVTMLSPTPNTHNRSAHISANNETQNRCVMSTDNHEIIRRASLQHCINTEMPPQLWVNDRRVSISIRGTLFETFESTLARYPDTLLGCEHKREQHYNNEKGQYCFNRSKEVFDAILYYYQSSGKLIRPEGVKEATFLDDLAFFEIDPWNVGELEYGSANFRRPPKRENNRPTRVIVEEDQGSSWSVSLQNSKTKYSTLCQILLSWPCAFVVAAYMISICMSSLGEYQSILPTACADVGYNTTSVVDTSDNPFVVLHFACSFWFLLEFGLRFTFAAHKLRYLLSFMGTVDIITVLSTLLQVTLHQVDICQATLRIWFANIARITAISCMFKLSRYYSGLRLFGLTLKACSGQLILSFYCIGICLLFFSAVIYFSESNINKDFHSIVDAFWYSMVTLTTVGYGDLVPMTIVGRIFGAMCSVFGVAIVMAWPATIFVSHFTEIYQDETGRKKKNKKNSVWYRGVYKFKKGLVRLDKRGCAMK